MRLLVTFILFCGNFSLLSQNLISGRVVDTESGEGLIGAHVYIPGDWRNGVITGPEGNYFLTLPAKDSVLTVTYVGYEEFVGVPEDGLVKLIPIAIKGEEIIVTAIPLISEEFSYEKINKIDIYLNPAAKADPILAVNSLPSSTTTDESANISLRGSSAIETGTFLNNVPIHDAVRYSQLNGIGTFSIFNTSIIEDVSVFPGNPPMEFGGTTSGVLALSTDRSILEESSNSAILSLANIGLSRNQKLDDRQSLKMFSNWQPSLAMKAINKEALNQIESFESGDFGVYWYGSSDKFSWKTFSYSLIEAYKFKFNHPSFSGIFDQQKRRTFWVNAVDIPLKKGVLSVNNGVSGSKGTYSYSNVEFQTKSQEIFFGTNYFLSNARWSIKSGLAIDYRKNRINGNFHSLDYALGADHPTEEYQSSNQTYPIEAFLYGKYFLSDEITIGTGLRKSIVSGSQPDYLSRQLNLSYTKDGLSLIMGTGKYHKIGVFENSDQSFFSKSRQTSVDVRYNWPRSEVSVSYFNKEGSLDSERYQVVGWEIYAEKTIYQRLNASTSITLLDAKSFSDDPYLYDINYFIRASLSYRTRDFWSFEMLSANRQGILSSQVIDASFDAENQVFQPVASVVDRLPAYFNLGISISKMYFLNNENTIIIFGSFNNILNYQNVRTYDYNFDYSLRTANLFSQRTGYLGAVINF